MLCPFMYPSALPEQKGYIMKKVIYIFANGEKSEVEVSDEIAAIITELEQVEENGSRKQRYHCYSLEDREEHGIEHASTEDHFKSLFEDVSYIEKIHYAIEQLKPTHKEIIIALFFEGKSQEEVARTLEINQSNVSRQLQTALKKIKKFL